MNLSRDGEDLDSWNKFITTELLIKIPKANKFPNFMMHFLRKRPDFALLKAK